LFQNGILRRFRRAPSGARTPGWHPPRRWRVIAAEFVSGENHYEAIYLCWAAIPGTPFS